MSVEIVRITGILTYSLDSRFRGNDTLHSLGWHGRCRATGNSQDRRDPDLRSVMVRTMTARAM